MRLDDVASRIVNANHSIMRSAVKLCVADCVAECIRPVVPQPTEWQRIGDQIDAAAMIRSAPDFVNVRRTLRLAGACEFKYLVALSG